MSTLGKSLKVVERERFFDDSFFREAWDDFDRAMQSVLLKFDTKVDAGSRTQCQDAYTKIRSNNIDQDLYASQAVQINEKDGKFQAVMDVKDFNPRELQVRAVDDRIVVEGSYQKVSEDGSSSSSKSFFREFALPPAADIDQVSTALSKDGILTIRAPKKEGYAVTEGPRPSNSSSTTTSNVQQSSSLGDNSSSFKSSSQKTTVQSSSSIDSSGEGFDSLPREMREKLMFCDSGFGSTKTSTCSSPAPSEAGSECSRVSSTMEFDLAKKAPMRTEVAFNVSTPSQVPSNQQQQPSQQAKFQPPPPQQQQPPLQQQQQPPYQQQQYQQQPQQQYQPPPQAPFQQQQQPQYQSPPQSPPYHQQSQSPFQSPPPQGGFQSPPPQSGFQSPPQQFQSPPMSPFQQPPPQGQFQQYQQQQFPPQSQFQQPPFQSPPPFMSPMSPQTPQQMFQQFSQFGGQACQPMPPNAPQPAWDQNPPTSSVAVGSGKQSNVNITEKNGRRVLTSQTSNVVQEKDGFMEHRETAAEITDKDSQAARREASSKMTRKEEDPKGKFKRTESADAAEVNESCVQQMPDGSVMSVKKSSTSTSSFKQSFSSAGDDSFFQPPPNFPVGFGDFRNLMGRGHNLMSQMSTDSMGSTLSGRSGFTDMSNFSQFSDTSSQFSDRSNFSNMPGFPDMAQMPMNRPQQQPPQQQQFPPGPGNMNPQSFSNSYSSSSSFSKSSFSSNFGDGTNF